MASDDDMLPSSVRNYAPVIRGVARSNARHHPSRMVTLSGETKVHAGGVRDLRFWPPPEEQAILT